jgi:hypothetical protein
MPHLSRGRRIRKRRRRRRRKRGRRRRRRRRKRRRKRKRSEYPHHLLYCREPKIYPKGKGRRLVGRKSQTILCMHTHSAYQRIFGNLYFEERNSSRGVSARPRGGVRTCTAHFRR